MCFIVMTYAGAKSYQKLIGEAVNTGQYAKALKYIDKVDTIIIEDNFVPPSVLDELLNYTITNKVSNDVTDKVLQWVASEFSSWGEMMALSKENYEDAEYYLQTAALCYEALAGKDSPFRTNVLMSLLELYNENERFEESLSIYFELADICYEKEDTVSFVNILNGLSLCYYRKGDIEISDSIQGLCRDWTYSISNKKVANYIYVSCAEQTAYFYFLMRDYSRAWNLYKSLLNVLTSNYEPERITAAVAIIKSRQGWIALVNGQIDEAKDNMEWAHPILTSDIERFGGQMVMNYMGLARIALYQHNFVESERLLTECLHYVRTLGDNVENISILLPVLDELATTEFLMYNYDSSLVHTIECLEWYDAFSFLEPDSYQLGMALFRKGILESEFGNTDSVYQPLIRSYLILKDVCWNIFQILPAEKREQYWETNKIRFTSVYPKWFDYFYRNGINEVAEIAYDNELFVKGLLLETMVSIKNAIMQSGDSTLIGLLNEKTRIDEYLSQIAIDGVSSPMIDKLRKKSEDIDRELSTKNKLYRLSKERQSTTWHDVQQSIGEKDCAIEIANYSEVVDNNIVDRYIAIVVDKQCVHPYIVPLFSDNEYKHLFNAQPSDLYGETGSILGDCIYSRLKQYFNLDGKVYIAPSGVLHNIAIENLMLGNGSRLGELVNIYRVSSTRKCIKNIAIDYSNTAVIYGGINYHTSAKEMITYSQKYPSLTNSYRSLDNQDLDRGEWRYLPNTKVEAYSIRDILSKIEMNVNVLEGAAGNEESFKALSNSNTRILHIATHGFYIPISEKQNADVMLQKFFYGQSHDSIFIDPLSRCGLVFSGATNTEIASSNIVQDGIGYACEIANMNLSGCELVVLSACQTAKGDISTEGVYGLQRAFKMAGVQTIIMSLWNVDDNATRLLMTEFYTNWIEKRQTKREAFKNAQNTVRVAVDEDGERMYENPYYWAGFIMLD